MTIDEVIAKEKANAEKLRKYNENCKYKSEYGCKGCDDYYSKPCIECAKEHEQLAEWLEELKALKENSISKETFEKMKSRAYKKGHRQVYNKAIDDFTEKMVIMMPGHMQDIERIAQQLKAGELYAGSD